MKTISFYSYKGGVGRSLALAYTATYLARNNIKVCVLDVDLEAPGILYKFRKEIDTSRNGLIDYIGEYLYNGVIPKNVESYFHTLHESEMGFVKVMSAGKGIDTPDYFNKLLDTRIEKLFLDQDGNGLDIFVELKHQIETQIKPDYLFIDSRSGVNIISRVCNSALSDWVVMLLTNNYESIVGSRIIYNHITNPDNRSAKKDIRVICAVTRVPFAAEDGTKSHNESRIISDFLKEIDDPALTESDIVVIHSDRNVENEESTVFQNRYGLEKNISYEYYLLIKKFVDTELLIDRKKLVQNRSKYSFIEPCLRGFEEELHKFGIDADDDELRERLKSLAVQTDQNSRLSELLYKLALIERHRENYFGAISALSRAIREGEENKWKMKAQYLRGWIFLYDLHNYIDSHSDFVRLKELKYKGDICLCYDLAVCLLCLDQVDQAISILDNHLKAIQKDYHSFLLRAFCNSMKRGYDFRRGVFKKGKIVAGIARTRIFDDFKKALLLKPDFSSAFFCRGSLYADLGEIDEALQDFNKAIEILPNNSTYYIGRGNLYYLSNENEKALSDYNKAIEIDPENAVAYGNRGRLYYYNLDENEKALDDYNKAIEIDPERPSVYNSRGNLFSFRGENEKAINDFCKAIEIDPEYSNAYSNRGHLYEDMDNNEKAFIDYCMAIELFPNNASAYRKRGEFYYRRLKEKEKALSDFDRAIEIDPEYAYAYRARGMLYYFGFKENEKALVDYSKAIEIMPSCSFLYGLRGGVHATLGNNESAIDDYSKAIEISQNDSYFYWSRGRVYVSMNENDKALEDFDEALEIDSTYKYAYTDRGALYLRLGNTEKALEDYNRAIEIDPDYASAYDDRGDIYSKIGEKEKADFNFNKSVSLNTKYDYSFYDANALAGELVNKFNLTSDFESELLKSGDSYVVSDQGSTYKELDKVFTLDDSDVKKNIISVLKEFQVIKNGNYLTIVINGSATIENQEFSEAIHRLFRCTSFLKRMRIFYEEREFISDEFAFKLQDDNASIDVDKQRIIEKYLLPSRYCENKVDFEFKLFEDNEMFFLSDQGRTYQMLDELFELKEADVTRNLCAIMQDCQVLQKGHELMVAIKNRAGDTDALSTETINEAKYRLFECTSFMDTMRIFYV